MALGLPGFTAEQQEQAGAQMLTESFRQLGAVVDQLKGWTTVDVTSRLSEDNAASNLYRPMTYELHYLLDSAVDHLDLVHKLWDEGQLRPFAPFTLIRSAIESCAYGIWIQQGGTLDARLIHLLELQWAQRQSVDRYTSAAGAQTQLLTDWLEAVLNDTKNRRSRLKQRQINNLPSITDILLKTDRFMAIKPGLDGLAAWRIASGVTHSNQHFATSLMNRKVIALADGSAGTEHSVSRFMLASVLKPAVDYLATLMRVVLEHSTARRGRPAPTPITGGPLPPRIPGVSR